MNIKKHIPNAITCGNLFCGCMAIVFAFEGNLVFSAYLVALAAILDFFDGFAARILKVSGELGKQLDSLADMVTFGVVPAIVMYHLLAQTFWNNMPPGTEMIDDKYYSILAYSPFLIAIFSAVRLAKFNIDTRQTSSFIGVPTPANAMLICSFPLIIQHHPQFASWILNPYFIVTVTLLMSYLLVAELPLFALKFKNFGWTDNKIRYSFLISSLILLILFQFLAIPIIIFLYIVLSMINNQIPTKQ